ncbi:hypothetical protein PT974_03128 [Cladobotryum mycophilum]|uniref:Catalase immune-responsive domain-containing protein n=1 Tax=Cladobotryum mycophilum TaxID=491253 RepID=A0ABR0SSN3_9HYPO
MITPETLVDLPSSFALEKVIETLCRTTHPSSSIGDPANFPHVIHSQKREPATHPSVGEGVEGAKKRFISNMAGHMQNCRVKEINKRQIAISCEASDDLATRLEKTTGVEGYDGISGLIFNGCHNVMSKPGGTLRAANQSDHTAGITVHNENSRYGTRIGQEAYATTLDDDL